MNEDQTQIKVAIKEWEYEFKRKNGKNPSKDDIKANHDISQKYKLYKKLKSKSIPVTPTKKNTNVQAITPVKTSPIRVDELGPTPQLNGRVLSIFDVITSPKMKSLRIIQDSNSNSNSTSKFEITETPSRKLSFPDIFSDSEFSNISNSEEKEKKKEEVQFQLSQLEFKTPTKNKVLNLMETPAYLKTSQSQFITASPSPLATQRMKKPLSTIINELKDIQADLKYGDYDVDELIPTIEEDKHKDVLSNEESDSKGFMKKATQKRTTRRVKMKARGTNDDSNLVGDLKSKIASFEKLKDIESDESEDQQWSENEKPYVRQKLDPDSKAPKRQNFKKYKIQKKKSNYLFGKRSKGY